MSIPTFGSKQNNISYHSRFGVYAIIPNPQRDALILVQAPNGSWFLPGGEIEAGENHNEALNRELLEELGFEAKIGSYLGQADEYFYSSHRNTHYHNPAYIYEVTSFTIIGQPLEDFNHLAWFPIQEAIIQLKRGSHKWGVEQWLTKHNQLQNNS